MVFMFRFFLMSRNSLLKWKTINMELVRIMRTVDTDKAFKQFKQVTRNHASLCGNT